MINFKRRLVQNAWPMSWSFTSPRSISTPSVAHRFYSVRMVRFITLSPSMVGGSGTAKFNPFTPERDQCQNSPAASQEIWHHTVWRTWLFIAYSDEKWLYYKFSLHHSYNRFLKGWENTLFELRSERVKRVGFQSLTTMLVMVISTEVEPNTIFMVDGSRAFRVFKSLNLCSTPQSTIMTKLSCYTRTTVLPSTITNFTVHEEILN